MKTIDLLTRRPRHSQTGAPLPNDTGWQDRHFAAVLQHVKPATWNNPRIAMESGLLHMLQGWLEYADAHRAAYDSPIGEDGVLGPAWQEMGEGLRSLLNGDLGRMDGGTLDGVILDAMSMNGIDTSQL